ncbi:MAG: cyclodeaminase/cyclohydrolase family protein [Deltaproteobacteria bacterium]|nr:cyclodeaminase/cyclohydrolase family protein [Deltaproteobacteria bacterium]
MSLVELSITDFVQELASERPAPGGGSVAALAGALAASLCAMVGNLTVGRKKQEKAWPAMTKVRDEAHVLKAELLRLVDADTEAYNRVTNAYRLAKENTEQQAGRLAAIQAAVHGAAQVPLETLKALSRLPELARQALELGNPNCLTDAGVAVQLVRAAAFGAAYNVRINARELKDQAEALKLLAETETTLQQILKEVIKLEGAVEERLSGFKV